MAWFGFAGKDGSSHDDRIVTERVGGEAQVDSVRVKKESRKHVQMHPCGLGETESV